MNSIKDKPQFIDQGSFGCVYSAPPKCLGKNKTFSNHEIAKVFKKEKYFKEELFFFQNVLNKIDPHNKFTPKYITSCSTNTQSIPAHNSEQCDFDLYNTKQLIMQNAGISLRSYVSEGSLMSKVDLVTVIKSMKNIVDGVHHMHQQNYIHYDIKPLNILYHNGENKGYLIDFSMMMRKNDVYNFKKTNRGLHSYKYYPHELYIIFNAYKNNHNRFQKLEPDSGFNELMEKMFRTKNLFESDLYYYLSRYLDRNIVRTFLLTLKHENRVNSLDRFFKQAKTVIDNQNNSKLTLNEKIFKMTKTFKLQDKIEVFSLGFSFLEIFLRLVRNDVNSYFTRRINIQDYKVFYENLLVLICRSIDSNPINRMSLKEFKAEFTKLTKL